MLQPYILKPAIRFILIGIFLTLLYFPAFSQNISGFIKDENNNPVAFANVFIRELNTGTAADAKGYYFLSIDPGVYNLVYSSIGYQPKTIQMIISDKPLKQDIILPASNAQLNEVVVKASRKDPAYEIIQHVIDNKEKFLTQVKTARTQVYLRATEVIDVKKKKAQADKEAEESSKEGPPLDQF